MTTHTVFTKEELARVKITVDTIKFYYSNSDALKELILERTYYKMVSEEQQKWYNEFIEELNKIIHKPLLSYA
jgi:hypothetical protein